MNLKIIRLLLVLMQIPFANFGFGQTNGNTPANLLPKIMVVPYTNADNDLRTVLETDENKRIAIAKIKESFDSKGYSTVDFIAKLKAATENNAFTSQNQSDIKSQLIEMSGADIYVQAEVIAERSTSGNSVKIILTAFEVSTGNSLANKVGESGKFYTEDFNKLTAKAVENCSPEFLNAMQAKFNEMMTYGKSVMVDISFAPGTQLTMSAEIGADRLPLSDQIEAWISENAFKNNYHLQGTTDLKMIFDDVKIPFKEPNTGNNYSPNKFALELFKFFKSLGLQAKKEVKGSSLYFTLNTNEPENTELNKAEKPVKNTVSELSDIDINIPVNTQNNTKTFVVIIANENYQKEVKVQFAANDGRMVKEYCEKTLGIPSENIHIAVDATYGNMKSEIKWLADVAGVFNGEAKLIFYYAGHGMPNETNKSAYLLPVDGFSSDFETAIKLDDLYARLTAIPAVSVTVFLDACFSGAIRDDGMLANARAVKVKPGANTIAGNMVVFSAANGDQTAYPYKAKQHGLFTYFLLKIIRESNGNADYNSLYNYVLENVKQQSIIVNQKSQTPLVNTSPELLNSWQTMKLR
ncbi:MAG TPA: hypothetical protein DCQ31_02530 [Bacteroidales bacterium]|nr:hypothetical protein [Bacteroidales bacterium]